MKKYKPFIKPIIFLTLGIGLMILFKDKYIELFFPKKDEKDFIIEFTTDYIANKDDILYNINENIDSYIILTINKKIDNFIVKDNNNIIINIKKINKGNKIVLMVNHNTYKSIITFSIDNKKYTITPNIKDDILSLNVEEKQE